MRLVFIAAGGDVYDVEADLRRPDAAVGDLAASLGAPTGAGASGLYVDGLYQPADFDLTDAGLHDGATVSFAPPAVDEQAAVVEGVAVSVLTGQAAGRSVALPADGEYLVGRDPACHVPLPDATVSHRHCRLRVDTVGTVTVTDEGSTAGTRIAGQAVTSPVTVAFDTPILAGSVLLSVGRMAIDDRVSGFERDLRLGAGTVSLNRPPRLVAEQAQGRLGPPQAPSNVDKPPFNLAAMLAPLGMGVVMVVAFHSLLFGLFALLSPVMLLGNYWETGRRASKNLRGSNREYARQLNRFDAEVETASDQETLRRRAASPPPTEILRRALLPSVQLWERRRDHDDFLRLEVGSTDADWQPQLDDSHKVLGPEVVDVLGAHHVLFDVPFTVDLGGGGVVGIVGPRPTALAAARHLLCQAAVLHGPADLRTVVVATDDPERVWDWTKWLPHTRDLARGTERRLLATGPDDTLDLLEGLVEEGRSGSADSPFAAPDRSARTADQPTTLYLIDGDELVSGRNAPARRLLSGGAGPAAGIVVAPSADRLPAVCTEIVTVSESGEATVLRPRLGATAHAVRLASLAAEPARAAAVALARLEDPELHAGAAVLPAVVRLGDLLGVERWDAERVEARWRRAASNRNRLSAPVGVAEDGVFDVDLDRHGPHGLIGGTTGSGKSELLKTLVASLAASYPPDQLTFGLFDFKGGSTFTEFATLPHTVGMASDLDVNLARRALRCLRAELHHRELVFDRIGVKDLTELNDRRALAPERAGELPSLPRLVVIIDEFAAMAKELSEEIGALADLTARGRSLGVHLLLATQKPSTAVNAEIKTNTRLRISLQVEDRQDSIDVVGIPDAATIDHKGRGYFRVGQGEVLPIQTGWSTSPSAVADGAAVEIAPFAFGPSRPASSGFEAASTTTELSVLVAAVRDANRRAGLLPPRRPWPDPLPDVLTLDDLDRIEVRHDLRDADDVIFALADDPDRQTRYPVGWSLRHGNLLLYGVVGSGTTTALASAAVAFARGGPPDRRHLYVIDGGAGDLVALEALPHCAAVVRAMEVERQARVMRTLSREVDRRRGLAAADRLACPTVVVVIDNLESFRASFDDVTGSNVWEQFVRLYADGPETGVYVVASLTRIGGVPNAVSTATPNKLLFRLADLMDYGAAGVTRSALPTFVPGRAVEAATAATVQVAMAGTTLEAAVASVAAGQAGRRGPAPVGVLRSAIPLAEMAHRSSVGADRWELVVAEREDDLQPGTLTLWEGEHGLVAGPARSGKSTALLTLAGALRAAAPDALLLGHGSRRSPLATSELLDHFGTGDELAGLVDLAEASSTPTLLLVDDADLVDDAGGRMASLLGDLHPLVHVVAAGKAESLRALYGHWTQVLRRSRSGLLLQPQLDRDGELLTAKLPYRVGIDMPAGRGFLISAGDVALVQLAS